MEEQRRARAAQAAPPSIQAAAVQTASVDRKEQTARDKLVERDLVALFRRARHPVRDHPAQAVRHPPRDDAEDGDGKAERG